MPSEVSLQPSHPGASLHDRGCGLREEGRAHPAFPDASKNRSLRDLRRLEPRSQRVRAATEDGFVRSGRGARPGLLGLAVFESIDEGVSACAAEVLHGGGGHFATSAPTTRKPKAKQGSITHSFEGLIAGGQHGFQFGTRDRGFIRRSLAAFH